MESVEVGTADIVKNYALGVQYTAGWQGRQGIV